MSCQSIVIFNGLRYSLGLNELLDRNYLVRRLQVVCYNHPIGKLADFIAKPQSCFRTPGGR